MDLSTQRSICEPICGDAEIMWPETCDDGNVIRGDGCSDYCQEELGILSLFIGGRKGPWSSLCKTIVSMPVYCVCLFLGCFGGWGLREGVEMCAGAVALAWQARAVPTPIRTDSVGDLFPHPLSSLCSTVMVFPPFWWTPMTLRQPVSRLR